MNRRSNRAVFLVAAALLGAFCAPTAAATKTTKKPSSPPQKAATRPGTVMRDPYLSAIVVEARTGRVLWAQQPDAIGHPASVLKLMDLLLVTEAIERGEVSLRDQVRVSAKAARTEESQVWLAQNESFTMEEMLFALMIKSANDAAVAIAEKMAGSTEAFIALMNKRAAELGMKDTVFRSVNGLPPPAGQQHDVTTARDIAILCGEVLKHPEILRYTSTRRRTFRPGPKAVLMLTHNHLLGKLEGCDGLKTGYTYRAGFCIAVTAARNGKRVIVVVLGSPSQKIRDGKAAELVEKGFALLEAPVDVRKPASQPVKSARK